MIRVALDLGDDGSGVPTLIALVVFAADALLQVITNVALGHGAALGSGISGVPIGVVGSGEGVLDHADLRAVAVGDDDLVTLLESHQVERAWAVLLTASICSTGLLPRALPPRATTIRSGLPRGLTFAGILSVKGRQPINNPCPCDTQFIKVYIPLSLILFILKIVER